MLLLYSSDIQQQQQKQRMPSSPLSLLSGRIRSRESSELYLLVFLLKFLNLHLLDSNACWSIAHSRWLYYVHLCRIHSCEPEMVDARLLSHLRSWIRCEKYQNRLRSLDLRYIAASPFLHRSSDDGRESIDGLCSAKWSHRVVDSCRPK